MERQSHGLMYEEYCKKEFTIELSNNYGSQFDGTMNDMPVSIKYEKFGTDIELADFFRNANITENFYLIVGFWKENKNQIIEQHMLYIKGQEYHSLFFQDINQDLKELLSTTTNDTKDDENWRTQCNKIKNNWKAHTSNLIRLRFKRDHKTQKRIQCAINNKDFYNYFIPRYEVRAYSNKIKL